MKRRVFPYYKIFLVLSILVSLVASIVVMQMALDHNPMGEYCEFPEDYAPDKSCKINWSHLLALGCGWFVFVFIAFLATYLIVVLIYHLFRRLIIIK